MTAIPDTASPSPSTPLATVALVTLGCARNEVDSEELAGRLEAGRLPARGRPRGRRDGRGQHLRLRRGGQEGLRRHAARRPPTSRPTGSARPSSRSAAWPSATARTSPSRCPRPTRCSGFDDYPDIAAELRSILAGEQHHPHTPQDRRRLLPITPGRPATPRAWSCPGTRISAPDLPAGAAPDSGPRAVRRRLDGGPMAPLKLATGCDRRCSFCAIPSFRGSFVSRRPSDVLGEARWLAEQGVKELFLVSENSTSYGKDLGDLRLLETLLPELAGRRRRRAGAGLLPPAGRDPARPGRRAIASTPGVAPYFDLSFQHASHAVLRRMRRFGDPESFLGPDRAGPLAGPAGRRPLQRDRRLPRRDRGGPGDPVRLPGRGPAGRGRRVRLLRRGRHRGGGVRRQARRGRDPRAHRARDPARRGAHLPARRGADRRDASRCWSSRSTATSPRAAPPTRAPRSTAPPRSRGCPVPASATSSSAVVTGSDGADLVAEAAS